MDNDSFTYIIRSKDKESSADNTNNCTVKLTGLPQHYRYFDCTVSALHVSTISGVFTTSTFELRADVLEIVNGRDTNNYALRTVAFASYNNTYPQGPYKFRCSNFNNRSVRFQLYDDTNALLKYSNNSFSFQGTFTYIGATTSTITITNTTSSTIQLSVGMVISNNALGTIGTIGTITSQTSSYVYVVTTTLTSTVNSIVMVANASLIDFNKSWILVLNMDGVD